jgi:hypothetical protein
MPSFCIVVAIDGKRTTVVVRPVTVDPEVGVDVPLDGMVLVLGELLFFELLLHPATRSAAAAIAASAARCREMQDIRHGLLIYKIEPGG